MASNFQLNLCAILEHPNHFLYKEHNNFNQGPVQDQVH
jgi:hypothetical protein